MQIYHKWRGLRLEITEYITQHHIPESNPSVIELIINDTYLVKDYYITDKKFNWLITSNHHDIIYFMGKGLDLKMIKSAVSSTN